MKAEARFHGVNLLCCFLTLVLLYFSPITSQQKHEHRIVPTIVSSKTSTQQANTQLWGIVRENNFDRLFGESEQKSETGKEEFVVELSMISAF